MSCSPKASNGRRRGLAPGAVDAAGVAELLGVSERTVRKLDATARLPRALSFGVDRKLWGVAEIEAWAAAGTPDREEWEERSR